MPSKAAWPTVMAVYGWPRAMKYIYLEKRSMMVRMTDFPWTMGRPSMKSIKRGHSSHCPPCPGERERQPPCSSGQGGTP